MYVYIIVYIVYAYTYTYMYWLVVPSPNHHLVEWIGWNDGKTMEHAPPCTHSAAKVLAIVSAFRDIFCKFPDTNCNVNWMFRHAWGVVFGLKLNAKSSLKASWAQLVEKVFKMIQNVAHGCFLLSLFVPAGLPWLPWGQFGRHFLNSWSIFWWLFYKKCACADSMPLSSRSAILAGSGVQVEATWVQKSRCRTALATFGRLVDGWVRGALSELWK